MTQKNSKFFFGKFLMNNFILWLVTHYESFFRVSCYHIIPEYLPWLQNDVKMQKPQNQIFHNQEKQWKNDAKTRKHKNPCSV